MVSLDRNVLISLIHWGRVTHICVDNLTIIGSNNGLSPVRRQAIIWINDEILLVGPLVTNFSEILIEIYTFLFKKRHLKMSSGKRRPFCLGLNALRDFIKFPVISSQNFFQAIARRGDVHRTLGSGLRWRDSWRNWGWSKNRLDVCHNLWRLLETSPGTICQWFEWGSQHHLYMKFHGMGKSNGRIISSTEISLTIKGVVLCGATLLHPVW